MLVATLGPNNSGANPAPTWVYVWFWVGLVPASLLFGPVWRALNPLRTLTMAISRVAGDREGELPREGDGSWIMKLIVLDPARLVDEHWRPIASEQLERQRRGEPLTHHLVELPGVSRRSRRLPPTPARCTA